MTTFYSGRAFHTEHLRLLILAYLTLNLFAKVISLLLVLLLSKQISNKFCRVERGATLKIPNKVFGCQMLRVCQNVPKSGVN